MCVYVMLVMYIQLYVNNRSLSNKYPVENAFVFLSHNHSAFYHNRDKHALAFYIEVPGSRPCEKFSVATSARTFLAIQSFVT